MGLGGLASIALLVPRLSSADDIPETAGDSAWLRKYIADHPDAVAKESGLIYRELKPGNEGAGSPEYGTSCSCHYEGRISGQYPDGDTFDSSYKRGQPTSFAPKQVVKCWTEAMQLMTVGAKWELVCPPEIAYGSRSMGAKIPANSILIFTMEMLDCPGIESGKGGDQGEL